MVAAAGTLVPMLPAYREYKAHVRFLEDAVLTAA